jgi:serine/threonine protein kinase
LTGAGQQLAGLGAGAQQAALQGAQAQLGAGGMGEVYKARDARLAATWRSRCCLTNSRTTLKGLPGSSAKRSRSYHSTRLNVIATRGLDRTGSGLGKDTSHLLNFGLRQAYKFSGLVVFSAMHSTCVGKTLGKSTINLTHSAASLGRPS